jgi:hypothetical protein
MDKHIYVSDDEIMESWYNFVATEHGFVGEMLKLLRDCEGTTPEQQQKIFGVNDQGFRRLEAMPMPRPKSLASDAHRIAEACNLANPFAFVQTIVLASKLGKTQNRKSEEEFYQAAFDPENDLDQIPDED